MKKEEFNDLAELVLGSITGTSENPTTRDELLRRTGLKLRDLKLIIYRLREHYPICSRETDGGGYWIANTDDDVREYIQMLVNRMRGNNTTIKYMLSHLKSLDE